MKYLCQKEEAGQKNNQARKTLFNPSVLLLRGAWFEAQGRHGRGAASTGDLLLRPMDAEPTSVPGFISERLPFDQENERCCSFVSQSQLKDCVWVL